MYYIKSIVEEWFFSLLYTRNIIGVFLHLKPWYLIAIKIKAYYTYTSLIHIPLKLCQFASLPYELLNPSHSIMNGTRVVISNCLISASTNLSQRKWLATAGMVIVEHAKYFIRFPCAWGSSLQRARNSFWYICLLNPTCKKLW